MKNVSFIIASRRLPALTGSTPVFSNERKASGFFRGIPYARPGISPIDAWPTSRYNDCVNIKEVFRKFAGNVSRWAGSPGAFFIAVLILIFWAISGPLFKYSDTWQLAINTGTTIVTFLMVFLIQNTQNRESRAINLKLDELIHAIGKARNDMIDMENVSDEELDKVEEQFHRMIMRMRNKKGDPATHKEKQPENGGK
jgi:low affinity Fe/Cu permease